MKERKAKEYVRKQLYQIDPLFVRSEKEAEALASNCRVSARALIMRAEAGSALPKEAWSGFYTALDDAEKRASGDWRQRLKDAMRQLRRYRRLATGIAVLVLALAFFTLVPAGRAIAEGIFNYVVAVFDRQLMIDDAEEKALYEANGYDVPDTMPPDVQYEEGELVIISEPVYYDTVAAFEKASGLDAFELTSDELTCAEVSETDDLFAGKTLRSNYLTADGKAVTIIQQWYEGDGQTISFNGDILEHEVLGGRTMQYAIDGKSGSLDGVVLLDDSVLMVYADAGVEPDFIWGLLS